MKALIFTTIILLISFWESCAQTLEISVDLGQTISFIGYETALFENPKPDDIYPLYDVTGLNDNYTRGNYISTFINYYPKNWIRCKTGLRFTQLGLDRWSNHSAGIRESYLHNYIGLPLEVSVLQNKTFCFYGGLSCNLRLNQHEIYKSSDDFHLHRFDITYQYGFGINIWKLHFKAQINKSLIPILSWKVEGLGKVNYYNTGFIFSLEIPVYTINKND